MGTNPKLNVGDQAPEFTAESGDGDKVSLADYRGQKVVLYFYPKAMTPGCTTQACDFRDNSDDIAEAGWAVLGVSPDPVDRLRRFRDEHDLNFPLLSDPNREIAQMYGVWREKQNYGKTYEGIVRSTFLIDEEGTISEIQDNVRAKGHVGRLLRDAIG